ncbi:PREDICTED: PWWP domain-containing protein 2B [Elephantulus edwardii]|uniref:PWWP domain-containing protein 2B n=1 Tax=Elephantulus edwardii TaxID=28737 RepID=UPI0003F0A40C|nr:PREDICTED: PWWP domain-containing protein 2B [Elephantulus edwardii]
MEPRAGCRLPVLVERVAPGALVVTWSCGERRFTGILLDCTHGSSFLGPPPPASRPKSQDTTASHHCGRAPQEGDSEAIHLGADSSLLCAKNVTSECPPPLAPPPPPAGSQPLYPPYFEDAPFPHPLWLRHTYGQWVPQPPPRPIKRTRRRLSRNRAPGRLILSTIRLRPRQVLCQKCQSSVSPEQSPHGAAPAAPPRRPASCPDLEPQQQEGPRVAPSRRSRREEDLPGELVPRSPVITISYSTPQGTGEVVKIPSRMHGSLEPFHPPLSGHQDPKVPDAELQAGRDMSPAASTTSIPKLKLMRPAPPGRDAPPPKIRLRPHWPGTGEPVYRAELVEGLSGHPANTAALFANGSSRDRMADRSPGNSSEEESVTFPRGEPRHQDLAFLVNYPMRKADSACESVCSSDSPEESKVSSPERAAARPCELSPRGRVQAPSSPRAGRPTVPPLTVRLHTQSVSRGVTEDGRTVAVGDIVWGKIPGFPWWPARILDISLSRKEQGAPSWREAKVSWFGSPTTSLLSLSKLAPFSEFFKLRFNRKKKGMYRKAIAEAATAAGHVAPELRELLAQFDNSGPEPSVSQALLASLLFMDGKAEAQVATWPRSGVSCSELTRERNHGFFGRHSACLVFRVVPFGPLSGSDNLLRPQTLQAPSTGDVIDLGSPLICEHQSKQVSQQKVHRAAVSRAKTAPQ